MGILSQGFSFLNATLPSTVSFLAVNASPVDIVGVWTNVSFDRETLKVAGGERFNADATFHVEQSNWPTGVDRMGRIVRNGDTYTILHAEPISDSSFRLHLRRQEKSGRNPMRR